MEECRTDGERVAAAAGRTVKSVGGGFYSVHHCPKKSRAKLPATRIISKEGIQSGKDRWNILAVNKKKKWTHQWTKKSRAEGCGQHFQKLWLHSAVHIEHATLPGLREVIILQNVL